MNISKTITLTLSVLLVLGILFGQTERVVPSSPTMQPQLIHQGPMSTISQANDRVYWFQVGAMGDGQTASTTGANVTIRTVYDRLNNDAHSYWVGSLLANNAFVQVGYLNGLSTAGQYYCCAWFYEFFPPGNTTSPPVIGPEGSAGPVGSWHTYSMVSVGNGVWNFYMDNNFLGSSPNPGNPFYLGGAASNTGSHFPAGIAEVAQTTTDQDIIGPAEFRNLDFKTSSTAWQPVPTGKVHIGLGQTSSQAPNPYSVAEVEGTQNDFLAGSYLPKAPIGFNPDPCANSDPTILWSPVPSPCSPSRTMTFLDQDGGALSPDWVSLRDASGWQVFYTNYTGERLPNPSNGNWSVSQVSWHTVNVTSPYVLNMTSPSYTVPTRVFSVKVSVVGILYSLPVNNATVTAYLPDNTRQTVRTDSNGEAILVQLPPSNYLIHITVPNGISANTNRLLDAPGTVTTRVFSFPEIITIIVLPIIATVAIISVIWRRESRRRAMLPPITAPALAPTNCRSCGQQLLPGSSFCANCGTPVGIISP